MQASVLLGIGGEIVHSQTVYLQSAGSGNPEVAALVGAEAGHLVVDEGARAVIGRITGGGAIWSYTGQSVAFGSHPDTSIGSRCHRGDALSAEGSVIAHYSPVTGAIPQVSVHVFGDGGNVPQRFGIKTIDIVAIESHTVAFRSHPQKVSIIHIDGLHRDNMLLIAVHALRFHALHAMGIHMGFEQSIVVGRNPNIAYLVGSHTGNAAVYVVID